LLLTAAGSRLCCALQRLWLANGRRSHVGKARPKLAADLMAKGIFTCKPDDRVDSVLDVMQRHRFRHVPVVDDGDVVVGVISDRDIRNVSFLSQADGTELSDLMVADIPVREIMVADPLTVGPDEPLINVLDTMKNKHVGCMPIVEDGKLLGIVTIVDFLELVRELLTEE